MQQRAIASAETPLTLKHRPRRIRWFRPLFVLATWGVCLGTTFVQSYAFELLKPLPSDSAVGQLFFHGSTLYAAGGFGMRGFYTHELADTTWHFTACSTAIFGVTLLPDGYLYAPLSGRNGVLESSDSGRTWFHRPTALDTVAVSSVTPLSTACLVAHTTAGLYLTEDAGGAWTNTCELVESIHLRAHSRVAVLDSTTVFAAASYREIYRSRDSGRSWVSVFSPVDEYRPIAVAIGPGGTVYVAGGSLEMTVWHDAGLVMRSSDHGDKWEVCDSGLASAGTYANAVVVDSCGTVYVATGGVYVSSKVFQSTDTGNTWIDISSGLPSTRVYDLALDPAHTLYAATEHGIYSNDTERDSCAADWRSATERQRYRPRSGRRGFWRGQAASETARMLFDCRGRLLRIGPASKTRSLAPTWYYAPRDDSE